MSDSFDDDDIITPREGESFEECLNRLSQECGTEKPDHSPSADEGPDQNPPHADDRADDVREESAIRRRTRLREERGEREETQKREQFRQDILSGSKVFVLERGYAFPDFKKLRGHSIDPYRTVRRLEDPVEIIQPSRIRESIERIRADFPHAMNTIEILSSSDRMKMDFGKPGPFRPVLLAGPPGCGKSSLARAYHEELGYPAMTMNVGAMSDTLAFTGTHQTFGDAKPSVIVEFLAQKATANPCMILDEIDKSPEGGKHGSVKDVLLQFLEPTEARKFRDVFLNAEVDLSHVRWVLTANDLDRVPAPLKSRCQIVHVGKPQKEHVPQLSRRIICELLEDIGLDARWFTLDGLEQTVLKENFKGDMRHLKRMVEHILKDKMKSLFAC
ncbi:AAA family ATPase [Gluconacetobacter sp. Hr-1-5]|uniref:AAA family ATPase n=1 Tax=Gluconacetobacter sp. Hr-1-5 TaxID=3395370 RepID=UPI003B51A8E5